MFQTSENCYLRIPWSIVDNTGAKISDELKASVESQLKVLVTEAIRVTIESHPNVDKLLYVCPKCSGPMINYHPNYNCVCDACFSPNYIEVVVDESCDSDVSDSSDSESDDDSSDGDSSDDDSTYSDCSDDSCKIDGCLCDNQHKTPYDLWIKSFEEKADHQMLSAILLKYYDTLDKNVIDYPGNLEWCNEYDQNELMKNLDKNNVGYLYKLREAKNVYIKKLKNKIV